MRIRGVLKNKKGMTLVEVLVASTITVMMVGVCISMLIAANNLFVENAALFQAKQIGDGVLDILVSELRYADAIEVGNAKKTDPLDPEQEQLYLSTDVSTPHELGRLCYGSGKLIDDIDYLGENFYAGMDVKLEIAPVDAANAATIRVRVLRNSEEKYQNEITLQLPNCSVQGESVLTMPTVITYSVPVI